LPVSRKWDESEIARRQEKIASLVQKNRDSSIIRIEESVANSSVLRTVHPEEESSWLKTIAETKAKLELASQRNALEEREVRELERELQMKRTRYAHLLEKKESMGRALQEFAAIEEDQEPLP
jgi:myosin heavy subunit